MPSRYTRRPTVDDLLPLGPVSLPDTYILAPEDIIIHKLIAGRHTDIDDIERILAADPALDLVYLEQWIDAWGVRDRWKQLRPG